MTLIFIDGFDHYTTTGQKWTLQGVGSPGSSGSARNGAGGMSSITTNCINTVAAALEDDTFIIGCAFRRRQAITSERSLFAVVSDTGATVHVTLSVSTAGKLTARRGTAAGTSLGSESGTTFSALNVWHYVEMKVKLSDTVGTVEVRVDGSATPVIGILSAQDTKNAGTKTTFDGYLLGATAADLDADDFYVLNKAGSQNNDFLGDVIVETLTPTSDGANTGLTPSTGTSHFALVDESPPNTTDYNSSSVNGTKDTYGYSNLSHSGTVAGVQVMIFAQKDDANAKSIRPVVRHSGTDNAGTDVALGTGFGYAKQLYETNPGTAAAWATADINAAEFGAEVRA